MGKGGRYLQKPAGGGWKKGLLIALVVILVLAIVVTACVILYIKGKFKLINIVTPETKEYTQEEIDNIMQYVPDDGVTYPVSTDETEETEATEETTEPTVAPTEDPTAYDPGKLGKIVNIMVVGQSWRPGEEGKMSDTMILCTVNKETKTLTLTSILRDTYVKLANYKDSGGTRHTCGNQRINIAYALGYSWGGAYDAMGMLNQTIYENFGAEIDYNVEVDFESFAKIVDTLGGVDIELTEAEADHMTNGLDDVGTFEPGMNHLTGEQALHYARIRKIDSDEARGNRQRKLIGILLDQMKAMSLSDLNNLIDTLLPMITTNMTEEDITTCIVELLPLLPKLQMVSNQIPIEGTDCGTMREIYGVMSGVLVPNLQKNREALTAITEELAE